MELMERSRRTPPWRVPLPREALESEVLVASREAGGVPFDPTGQWMEPSDQLNVPSYELMELSDWEDTVSAGAGQGQ
jgi:hypothetical protein